MANSVSSERLWIIDTASATALVACGTQVYIKKLVLIPAAASNTCTIQEYDSAAAARTGILIAADSVDAKIQQMDWSPSRRLNGMIVSTLTSGAKLYIYFGEPGE